MTAEVGAPAVGGEAELAARSWRLPHFDELGILIAAIALFAIGASSSGYFLTGSNLTGILQSITFTGFLAVGVALVLMAGEIDISVGSIYGLAGVVTALMLKNGYPVPAAVSAGVLTGLACGTLNGLIAQVINVPAIVVSLATLGVYRTLALVLSNGAPVTGMPDAPAFFEVFGQSRFYGISFITFLFLLIVVLAEFVLRRTAFGFRLLAIGSNPLAARLVGFHVERTRLILLATSGLLAGLSGVCSVAYLYTAGPTAGMGYELTVLAASIIGGIQLTGGRGSILGALLGLVVIGILQNLIVLWGVSPNWTLGVSGIVLIAAVTISWLTTKVFSRQGKAAPLVNTSDNAKTEKDDDQV